MKYAKSSKEILKIIGCDNLSLVYCTGEAYWYFVYDDIKNNKFETESVYTPRLKDMTVEQWVAVGKDFVNKIENP